MVENENKKNKKFFIIGGVLLIVIVAVILIMVFLPKKKKEVSYNILFDSAGGTTVQEQSLKKGEKVKTPDFPEKDGYVFEYWMLDGKEYDFNSEVSSDIKLKAKWKVVEEGKVVVSFDSDGGTLVKSQEIDKGTKAIEPEKPTKADYEFLYWTYNGKEYHFDSEVQENITLKAVWKKVEVSSNISNSNKNTNANKPNRNDWKNCGKLTLSYDTNGGKPIPPSQEITLQSKYDKTGEHYKNSHAKVPVSPTKEGYKFIGWHANYYQMINTKWDSCDSLKLIDEAKWEYISQAPVLDVKYVDTLIENIDKEHEIEYLVYKVTNTSYICDLNAYSKTCDRWWELYVRGNLADGVKPGYEKEEVYWSLVPYARYNISNKTVNIKNENLGTNELFYRIDDINQNYIYVIVPKVNAGYQIVARERGTCFKIDGGCGNNTLSNETPGSGTVYSKWSLKKAI